MASLFAVLAIAILAFGVAHSAAPPARISSLNVLLPPKASAAVRYRLQGYGGCFVWTWDHHDVISVEPEYNDTSGGCSTSAVITPIAPFEERQATAVHATDTVTGEVLRCEVFVDKPSRIQIFHHSVKLDLDGWATLRVRAFDAHDNVFSSLVGLRFVWQLMGGVPHKLLHVPLKDSPLSDCGSGCGKFDTQIDLEERGYGSDLYVVRGIAPGQEMVKATLMELNMDELEDALLLTVAEAISLEPHSPVYVIPGTQFQFRLKAVRQNVLREITLPSTSHQWFSTNSSLVAIDRQKGVATVAKNTGATNIVVEDVRVKGHQQLATVYVVTPTSLQLFLSPFTDEALNFRTPWRSDAKLISATWYLVKGREYVVHTLAFSLQSGTRPLYLTQSNKLSLAFTHLPYWEAVEVPGHLALEQGWQNASILYAMAPGSGILVAELSYEDEEGVKELKVKQGVEVCEPVSIVAGSSTVYLPWSPGFSQHYELTARGGCGTKITDYVCSSSDPTVATVDSHGIVYTKGPGKADIHVASVFDHLNTAEIQVEVSIPSSIAPVHGLPVEVEVNTKIPAAVTLTSASGLSYSRCDAYNSVVQWDLFGSDGSFALTESSDSASEILKYLNKGKSMCAWVSILPTRPGRATVSASLKVSSAEVPSFLEASWLVASYAPLALEQVSDGSCCGGYSCVDEAVEQHACDSLKELLLVVGSSAKVTLKGGPERWREGFIFLEYHEVRSDHTGREAAVEVPVFRTADAGGRTFSISCSGFGNYTLLFYRGHQDMEETINVVASTSMAVVCSVPASAVLVIDEPVNSLRHVKAFSHLERDHDRKRVAPVTVVNGRSIRVAAVALHESGKPFANASSLALSWDLEGCNGMAYWENVVESWSWERRLILENNVGLCTVRATISHLKTGVIPASATVVLKHAKAHLTDAAQLQLVAALRLSPKEVLLLSHPDAKATMEVIGGTSSIESHVNDSRVATVIQAPVGTRSHLTVSARSKGSALLSIRDVGLASPASATAIVHVADVAWVRLIPEDVSLQLGDTTELQLQAGDAVGRVFDAFQVELLKLRVDFQDDIIELANGALAGSSLKIRAANIGVTTFHVTVPGRQLHSEFAKVEVYPPFEIQPFPLVLAPGAQYMLTVHGGPRAGVLVVFSSSNPIVADVDRSTGLVTARTIGNEVVVAKAYGHDGLLLGEVSTGVTVSIPVTVSLEVGSGQLGIGRQMSLFPTANEGNLFSIFEMCANYDWSTTNDEVLRVDSIDPSSRRQAEPSASSSSEPSESTWLIDAGFSARVTGRSPGRATVKVKFVCHFHGRSEPTTYSASDTVTVLPDPPLALGMCATWVLPPVYRSRRPLPQRSSEGMPRTITYSLMQNGAGISIDDGYIRTFDRADGTCIHAKDRSTGRTEVAACVRVAEITQMTVGDSDFPCHVAELSVGTEQSFTAMPRDTIGTPFSEIDLESFPLSIETNRPDIVWAKATVGSGLVSVTVHALRQGKALICITHKDKPGVVDYILVLVGAYVYPRNPTLHIGNRANFSIAGKGLHPSSTFVERGQWSSSNDKIIRVNSRTGEAEAVGEGVTTVSFNGSRLTAYTTVTVVGISSVLVQSPKLQYITNVPFPDQGYKFPVGFRDSRGGEAGLLGEISFDCSVHPSVIGRAVAKHDRSTGTSSCMFFPYSPENIAFSLHGELRSKKPVGGVGDPKGLLPMKIVAFLTTTPDVAGAAEATFAGGFSIIETPPQLQLSPKSNKSRIVVVGSVGGLVLSWQRREAMDVKTVSKVDDLGVGGHAVYEVNLLDEDSSFSDKLVFVLPTTGQREEIQLLYEAGQLHTAAVSQQVLTVLVITLVCLGVPLFACNRFLEWTSTKNRVHFSPASPAALSPGRASPMVGQVKLGDGYGDGVIVDDGFPVSDDITTPLQHQFTAFSRSPPSQPYTEYVSRTIGRTPYFSRAQRTDPSKTY